jgi:dihydroorotase
MSVLIKQARLFCQGSPLDGQSKDIFIEGGTIRAIANELHPAATYVIDQPGVCVSLGWADLFAHFTDPGLEHRETLASGAAAAAAGGFTDVLVLPNTQPSVHNKAQVGYIVQKAVGLPVNLHPIGAVSKNVEGKELAEMYDMYQAGAKAFSDGIHALQPAGVLLKALQYLLAFDGTLLQLPDDKSIGANGLINEGIVSTQLGLPGKPAIAEELMIARDIELLRYTGSRLHLTGISSEKGIQLVTKAKAEGLRITCSVTPLHLCFCDEDLRGYDTNLKLNPPLRTRTDMMALRQAVQEGWVDCLASHHLPQHGDAKDCEFEYASHGATALQTMLGAALLAGIAPERFVQMQTVGVRTAVGLSMPELKEGAPACLTIFNPNGQSTLNDVNNASQSKNSPFYNQPLPGKVLGIVNGQNELIHAE